MWHKALIISFLLFSLTEGVKFRYDYSYSQLSEGWLKLHREPATWHDARLQCYLEGAVLASPLTTDLRDELSRVVQSEQYPPSLIHTGVHATFSKGTYNSIEGIPFLKLAATWVPGEVDNTKNIEDCLALVVAEVNTQSHGNINGTMIDLACNTSLPYICYKKKPEAMLVISDCGTADPAYHLDARTGSCYKFHRQCATWSLAYKTCDAEGGHLAIVNSDAESLLLKEIFAQNSDDDIALYQHCNTTSEAFIGMAKEGYGEAWMTIQGKSLQDAGYESWTSGNPSNPDCYFCGSYFREGDFSDNSCDALLPFICEKHPDSLDNIDNTLYG